MTRHFCTHRPLLMGARWMITADHPLAAQAGAAVLEEGGNAVDAAIAANLVMTTVRPHMCGIGAISSPSSTWPARGPSRL